MFWRHLQFQIPNSLTCNYKIASNDIPKKVLSCLFCISPYVVLRKIPVISNFFRNFIVIRTQRITKSPAGFIQNIVISKLIESGLELSLRQGCVISYKMFRKELIIHKLLPKYIVFKKTQLFSVIAI